MFGRDGLSLVNQCVSSGLRGDEGSPRAASRKHEKNEDYKKKAENVRI